MTREFGSYRDAKAALTEAFADYNGYRIYSVIGYMTPAEFAAQWKLRNK